MWRATVAGSMSAAASNGDVVGQGQDVGLGNHDALGQRSGPARANERIAGTGGEAAGPALVAGVVGDERHDHRVTSDEPAVHALAHSVDHAGGLVAEDHRVRPVTASEAMDVRAADGARAHLEPHLAGARHRVRDVADGDLETILQHERLHGSCTSVIGRAPAMRSNCGSIARDRPCQISNCSLYLSCRRGIGFAGRPLREQPLDGLARVARKPGCPCAQREQGQARASSGAIGQPGDRERPTRCVRLDLIPDGRPRGSSLPQPLGNPVPTSFGQLQVVHDRERTALEHRPNQVGSLRRVGESRRRRPAACCSRGAFARRRGTAGTARRWRRRARPPPPRSARRS